MLWVCHIWILLCWDMFLLCLISGEIFIINGCWILWGFLCIHWNNHMVFIFHFVNMVYYIDWFGNINLHRWNKIYLFMIYDLLNMLLDSWREFCWEFLHLCSPVILAHSFVLCHICLILVLGWWCPCRMNLGVFLPLEFSGRVWVGCVLALL